jgi:hypothetical protein
MNITSTNKTLATLFSFEAFLTPLYGDRMEATGLTYASLTLTFCLLSPICLLQGRKWMCAESKIIYAISTLFGTTKQSFGKYSIGRGKKIDIWREICHFFTFFYRNH